MIEKKTNQEMNLQMIKTTERKKRNKMLKEKLKNRQEKIFNKIKENREKILGVVKRILFVVLFLFLCYLIMDLLNGADIRFVEFKNATWQDRITIIQETYKDMFETIKFVSNYVVFIFAYAIIYGITNRNRVTCAIISIITVCYGIINYLVIRSKRSSCNDFRYLFY